MKIALIGATGYAGSKILSEALARGHQVSAIARKPEVLEPNLNVKPLKADIYDVDAVARLLAGHDAIIDAFNPGRGSTDADIFEQHVRGHLAIIEAVKESGVKRFLAVGGAGSLKVASGKEFIDSDEFPADYAPFKSAILGTRELYYLLKTEPGLDWVFLAPPSRMEPGERTGKYRVGKDHLLVDESGESHISLEDFAVAMIDELDRPGPDPALRRALQERPQFPGPSASSQPVAARRQFRDLLRQILCLRDRVPG
jgi:putative NADH-flavin reductase